MRCSIRTLSILGVVLASGGSLLLAIGTGHSPHLVSRPSSTEFDGQAKSGLDPAAPPASARAPEVRTPRGARDNATARDSAEGGAVEWALRALSDDGVEWTPLLNLKTYEVLRDAGDLRVACAALQRFELLQHAGLGRNYATELLTLVARHGTASDVAYVAEIVRGGAECRFQAITALSQAGSDDANSAVLALFDEGCVWASEMEEFVSKNPVAAQPALSHYVELAGRGEPLPRGITIENVASMYGASIRTPAELLKLLDVVTAYPDPLPMLFAVRSARCVGNDVSSLTHVSERVIAELEALAISFSNSSGQSKRLGELLSALRAFDFTWSLRCMDALSRIRASLRPENDGQMRQCNELIAHMQAFLR